MKAATPSIDYSSLSEQDKLLFLAALAHDLTVAARETYVPGTEAVADPGRLRSINELQHRISSQQRDMLAKSNARYPDPVFIAMVMSALHEIGCQHLATGGLARLAAASQRQASR